MLQNSWLAAWQTHSSKIILHRLFPVFLACILAFALRLYRLEYPQRMYFDEVYHGFTAVEYASENAAAYDPWASPPAGYAYEWTHPPLAKLFMAGSVELLGPNSLAWRLPPALFGSISILLAALLADELFHSSRIAILTAFLLSLDGLNFVMSRLAMNDTTFVCFMLAALLTYLKAKRAKGDRQLLLFLVAGVSLGLALASKWTTLYVFGLIGLDQMVTWWNQKRLPNPVQFIWLALTLGLLPILVYVLSYLHYFSFGYTIENFIELQRQMWWYHTNLVATHGYQSRPWQWILDLRPVWMFSGNTATVSENIYALGNPLFFYGGLIAIATTIWEMVQKRMRNCQAELFVTLGYFALWLPWVFSPRIMFFYHYFPATLFLAIVLARFLVKNWWTEKQPSKILWGILVAIALWFLLFYPQLSAMKMPRSFADTLYYVIPSWR